MGALDSSVEGKKRRKDREQQKFLTGPQVVENVTAFWATHGLAGSVSMSSLARTIMVTNRMCQEKGPKYAVLYFKNLVSHIRSSMATASPSFTTFDDFLIKVVPEVEVLTNIRIGQVTPAKGTAKGKDQFSPIRRSTIGSTAAGSPAARVFNKSVTSSSQVQLRPDGTTTPTTAHSIRKHLGTMPRG